jgi:hypothetical protein
MLSLFVKTTNVTELAKVRHTYNNLFHNSCKKTKLITLISNGASKLQNYDFPLPHILKSARMYQNSIRILPTAHYERLKKR